MAKFMKEKDNEAYLFYCPACECAHRIQSDKTKTPCWEFNNDLDNPTVSPSIRVRHYSNKLKKKLNCHTFVKNGQIQYCSDCNHKFKNKTVEIPDWEDYNEKS
jgi:hypothetical protein